MVWQRGSLTLSYVAKATKDDVQLIILNQTRIALSSMHHGDRVYNPKSILYVQNQIDWLINGPTEL